MSESVPAESGGVLIRAGNFLFRTRNYVFPAVLIVLVALFPPGSSGGKMVIAAIILAVLGEALRAAVVGLAYIKRGGLDKKVYAERLVVEGLFAHCRNPLYVGNALMLVALLVLADNLWIFLIGGAFFIFAYAAIVAAEENYLRGKFGAEYEDYCRRVNRWVPDFRGFGETWNSMTFNWRRVILKEYSSIYSWIVVALLLEAVKTVRAPGAADSAYLTTLAVIFAAASVMLVTVYTLKKSRMLVDRPPS